MIIKILITEPIEQSILKEYEQNPSYLIDYQPSISKELTASLLISNPYDAIIVGSGSMDEHMIKSWRHNNPNKKLCIVRAGSSVDKIDLEQASLSEIIVMNSAGANSHSVMVHIMSRVLQFADNGKSAIAQDDLKSGKHGERQNYLHSDASEKILALIGTGAIGSKVAIAAQAFGMKVQAYSPNFTQEKAQSWGNNIIYCNSLEQALSGADYLSIQVPTNDDTLNMITSKEISLLQDGASIINISGRDVINMNDLFIALKNKKIANFSLDTKIVEVNELRLKLPELFELNNVFITPSISTATHEAFAEVSKQAMLRVKWLFEENRVVNRVNRLF